jgi:two-component system OmpR family sensor kinase
MLARLSLRARLILGTIALAALGLAVANVVTYTSLRSFLFDRTDESLRESGLATTRFVFEHGCPGDAGRPPPGTERGDAIEIRNSAGDVVCSIQITGIGEAPASPPRLPESIEAPADGERATYFTAPAEEGGGRYRVAAWVDPRTDAMIIHATSLEDVDATLRRLLVIEVLVTAAVLVALALLGAWVVRLGLRPLRAIEDTAAGIAGGDLSRRVERAEPRTEVGRLGLALNAMLGQIETAFDAQAASERKLRRFVADASHELRTPLAAVRAYAELFGRGAETRPDDLARAMDGIERESERMSVLVDDLLLLARLDEGRPLERDPVALDEVVAEAVDAARTLEPDRPVELEATAAPVVGDRDRLRQIVDNLLSNVRAHTPPGSPVHVRVGAVNGSAVIAVKDSGPGLSDQDAQRVFERFYRADASRSRTSGGVGLGLAIVAAVAEAHGGTAAATSRPGAGATFEITLPLADNSSTNGGTP